MQKADLECGRYTACYDPSTIDPVAWSLPDVLALLAIAALVIWLIWALAQPVEKPKPPIEDAVDGVIADLETQALLWGRPEAASAFRNARTRIKKEFTDRKS